MSLRNTVVVFISKKINAFHQHRLNCKGFANTGKGDPWNQMCRICVSRVCVRFTRLLFLLLLLQMPARGHYRPYLGAQQRTQTRVASLVEARKKWDFEFAVFTTRNSGTVSVLHTGWLPLERRENGGQLRWNGRQICCIPTPHFRLDREQFTLAGGGTWSQRAGEGEKIVLRCEAGKSSQVFIPPIRIVQKKTGKRKKRIFL